MSYPVSIATDVTGGGNYHGTMPPNLDLFDCSAPMNWPQGAHKHVMAPNVLHKGQRIVLEGHDLGPMLPHAPSGFCLHLIKSKRTPSFSASTVKAASAPVAVVDAPWHLMMLCGDISLPYGLNLNNPSHTVFVGMTAADQVAGYLAIGLSIAIDVAAMMSGPEGITMEWAAEQMGFEWKKSAKGAVASLVTSIVFSAMNGFETPISMKGDFGNGIMSIGGEASWDPQTNKWTFKEEPRWANYKLPLQQNVDGRYMTPPQRSERGWKL